MLGVGRYLNLCIGTFIIAVFVFIYFVNTAPAQVTPPDPKHVFREDSRAYKKEHKQRIKALHKKISPDAKGTYFDAPEVSYDRKSKVVRGKGGVTVSVNGIQIEAEEGTYNMETKKAVFNRNVLVSGFGGDLRASSGRFNFTSETGSFRDADFLIEDGGYRVKARKLRKVSTEKYSLEDAQFSTCDCVDGTFPWSLNSKKVRITKEGYAVAKHLTLKCGGLPLFYTPYFFFPAMTERHSGFLVPEIGYSKKDGIKFSIPYFAALDDNTDLMLTPFIKSNTRRGIGVDLKKIYSRKSELDAGLLYSDESPRGDSLRGTVVSDVFEPSVDTNRFGGHLSYRWSSGRNLLLPVSLLADGRYVSDPLFLREIENYKIGRPEDRFLSSKAIVSAPLGDYMNLQLRVEGTQSISSDTDLVFMRVPELTLDGYRSFRVFGINPYGLKLIGSGDITVTRFARKKGFDGTRVEAHPAVKLPFYYKNYLSGDIGFNVRRTYYTLNERADPNNPQTILPSTSSRTIYETAINLSTVLERVFELGKGNLLRRLGAIGVRGEYNDIVRVKHTLEPFVQFVYVPDVNQDDTPLFDANDHLKGRKVVTYGIESFLIGRRRYIAEKEGKISELEPDERELMEDIFEDYPSNAVQEVDESFILRRKKGEKGQIAKFSIKQSYDRMVDASAGSNRFSDINGTVEFRPNHYMGFMFGSNYDYNDGGFSSWGADVELSDDRGDHLRGRVTSVRDVVSQFEGNVELVFSKRMKVGFYGKYDDLTGEFIEWKGVVRILSGCDCWKLDIGYREQLNPDDQDLTIVLTLKGLGEIG